MTTILRWLLQLLRALLAILRAATGRTPQRPSSTNPWLAMNSATIRHDDDWALAIELQAAEHTGRRRAIESHRRR